MAGETDSKYVLHIGNKNYSSWSMRPWVVMKALDIPFVESLHVLGPGIRQSQFFEFNPRGQVPCLHDPTVSKDEPLVVWDSLAILQHLSYTHPGIWPTEPAARAFALSAACEMHSSFVPMRNELSMNCGLRVALGRGEPSEALQRDLVRLEQLWLDGLEKFGGPWLAGPAFCAADAFYAPVAVRLRTYGLVLNDARANKYAERLLDHKAVKEWVDAGVDEPYREGLHEAECTASGRTVLKDLRDGHR